MERASISLPVPVSPVINTLTSQGATFWARANTLCIGLVEITNSPNGLAWTVATAIATALFYLPEALRSPQHQSQFDHIGRTGERIVDAIFQCAPDHGTILFAQDGNHGRRCFKLLDLLDKLECRLPTAGRVSLGAQVE